MREPPSQSAPNWGFIQRNAIHQKGAHSFECIPAPINLGSREAVVQPGSSYRPLQSGGTLENRRGVIDFFGIRSRLDASSIKKEVGYSRLQQMVAGRQYFTT